MFTEKPIKILGIAACVEREEAFYIVHGQNRYFNTIDTTLAGRVLDSLILYKATPEGPALLTAGTWRIEDPHRYIVLPSRKQSLTPVACETQHDTIPKAPLYEVMFEKPQVVTDSFIVVGTSNNNTQSVVRLSDYSNDEELLWDRNRTLYWGLRSYTEEPDTCNISWLKYKHYDWVREGDEIKIVEEYWPKDEHGDYAVKNNGGRYLRYLVSLGYDLLPMDPLTDKTSINYLNEWDAEMREHLAHGELKVLKENAEVMWLTSPKKSLYSGGMREEALKNVMKFTYGDINETQYMGKFGSLWTEVLKEINDILGK
jgi:hypothetical protein